MGNVVKQFRFNTDKEKESAILAFLDRCDRFQSRVVIMAISDFIEKNGISEYTHTEIAAFVKFKQALEAPKGEQTVKKRNNPPVPKKKEAANALNPGINMEVTPAAEKIHQQQPQIPLQEEIFISPEAKSSMNQVLSLFNRGQ